jgi:hypothetical protein
LLLTTLLVATMSSTPALPASAQDTSVSLNTAYEEVLQAKHSTGEFAAKLSAESTVAPEGGLFALAQAASFNQGAHSPFDGAAMSQEGRSILALILGLVVGLGIGHLVAQDKDGFVLFLIVDIVLIAATVALPYILAPIWWIPNLLLLISHVYQGIDAYGKASGSPLIRRSIENTIQVAGLPGDRMAPAMTPRTFGFSF